MNELTVKQAKSSLTYKQLQASLKQLKSEGHTLQVKLNAKAEILQAEYDRLTKVDESQLDGSFSELTCEVVFTTFDKQQPTNKETPVKVIEVKKVNAQKVSETKRQLSQAPRHRTPIAEKYINKQVKAVVEPIKKVSCTFSKTHDEHFINPQHTRFIKVIDTVKSTLKTDTERQALNNLVSLTDKVVSISNAANNILKGFNQRQAERNNINKPIKKVICHSYSA